MGLTRSPFHSLSNISEADCLHWPCWVPGWGLQPCTASQLGSLRIPLRSGPCACTWHKCAGTGMNTHRPLFHEEQMRSSVSGLVTHLVAWRELAGTVAVGCDSCRKARSGLVPDTVCIACYSLTRGTLLSLHVDWHSTSARGEALPMLPTAGSTTCHTPASLAHHGIGPL